MVDPINIPAQQEYELECFNNARDYLRDNEIVEALEKLMIEKGMNADEIKAAAELIDIIASGDID